MKQTISIEELAICLDSVEMEFLELRQPITDENGKWEIQENDADKAYFHGVEDALGALRETIEYELKHSHEDDVAKQKDFNRFAEIDIV